MHAQKQFKSSKVCLFFFCSSYTLLSQAEGANGRQTQPKCAGTNFKIRMLVPSVCAVWNDSSAFGSQSIKNAKLEHESPPLAPSLKLNRIWNIEYNEETKTALKIEVFCGQHTYFRNEVYEDMTLHKHKSFRKLSLWDCFSLHLFIYCSISVFLLSLGCCRVVSEGSAGI